MVLFGTIRKLMRTDDSKTMTSSGHGHRSRDEEKNRHLKACDQHTRPYETHSMRAHRGSVSSTSERTRTSDEDQHMEDVGDETRSEQHEDKVEAVAELNSKKEKRAIEASKQSAEASDLKLASSFKTHEQDVVIKELKEKLTDCAKAYNDLKGKVKTKEDELYQQKRSTAHWNDAYLTIMEGRNNIVNEYNILFEMAKHHEHEKQAWAEGNTKLEKKLKEQAGIIRQTQEDAFRSGELAAWAPGPDSALADELRNLEGLIRNFSKQNAVGNSDGVSMKDNFPLSVTREGEIITMDGWKALEDPRRRKTAPWLLMSAWLTRHICNEIFLYPFFFLNGFEGEERDASGVIWDIFREMEIVHGLESKEVNTARSDMLRLFNPLDIDRASSELDVFKKQVSEAKSMTTGLSISGFFDLASPLLKDGDRKDMREKLREIFGKAVQISTRMTTQRSGLFCKGLKSLPQKYDHNSKEIEAHWLHNNDLEDDEAAFDGRPILLVTQPAIVAVGKSDGSDYSSRRVLKKAIVWMG